MSAIYMAVRWLDFAVICVYVLGLTGIGLRFARRQTSTERYFTAKRTVPFWAVGTSFLTAMVTSVTFIAFPGAAYAKDWSLLIPGFLLIGVLLVVGLTIIPFYRRTVRMSAFEYFGKRFGRPTRVYASLAFTLAHFSKMGLVFYLLALTVHSMTGWSMDQTIVISGLLTLLYTLKGGFEAVIWTEVLQGIVLWSGTVWVLIIYGFFWYLQRCTSVWSVV